MQNMSKRDVKPTVEIVRGIASRLRDESAEIDRIADRMLVDGTFDRVSDVIVEISTLLNALRLDLLVTRPIREYERNIHDSPDES